MRQTPNRPITFLDGTRVQQAPQSLSFFKSQVLLGQTIDNLFLRQTVAGVLFITLSFPSPIHSVKEAYGRLNSFLNKVRRRHAQHIWVLQPHESGAIHHHLLIPVTFDAHAGTDLDPWANRNNHNDAQRLQAMNPALRAESDWWTTTAPRYGFGRVEVAPVYSNAEALRNYLTRQDWRTQHWPFVETSHVRWWSCSKSARAGSVQFSWNTPGGQRCRARLREWAQDQGCQTYDELSAKLGPRWGFWFHLHVQRVRAQEGL